MIKLFIALALVSLVNLIDATITYGKVNPAVVCSPDNVGGQLTFKPIPNDSIIEVDGQVFVIRGFTDEPVYTGGITVRSCGWKDK